MIYCCLVNTNMPFYKINWPWKVPHIYFHLHVPILQYNQITYKKNTRKCFFFVLPVGSPPWAMKFGTTRWKIVPLKNCSRQSCTKFLQAFGHSLLQSSISISPKDVVTTTFFQKQNKLFYRTSCLLLSMFPILCSHVYYVPT